MARLEVPDTSALLRILRQSDPWTDLDRAFRSGRVWLSSVVIAELYAGTRSPRDALILNRFVDSVARMHRLITPGADDWLVAGRLLARRARLYGDVRPRDHLADVLILLSAARLTGTVLTLNLRHFEAWARLANAAGLDVAVRAPGQAE